MTVTAVLSYEVMKCPRCHQQTPHSGKFCMMCGKGLVLYKQGRIQPNIEQLQIVDGCDTKPFAAWLAKHSDYNGEEIPIDLLKAAFAELSRTRSQLLIRNFGLDGRPPRTLRAIAEEFGTTAGQLGRLKKRSRSGLRHPRHGLMDHIGTSDN